MSKPSGVVHPKVAGKQEAIVALWISGMRQKEIAEQFGVSSPVIHQILQKRCKFDGVHTLRERK